MSVDGLPSVFPPPHPDATGSLGDMFTRFAEDRIASDTRTPWTGLRWWQWLAAQRILEVRGDGSWCWPVSFVSVSRQSGKSRLMGELAIWRAAHPDLFGGVQEVASSASTVVLSRLLQSHWWSWAVDRGLTVRRQLGDSSLIWGDGSRWVTVAPENMYGRSQNMALIDEAWSWAAEDWWQATWPTLVEQPRAQAVLFSAANDQPKSLVDSLRGNADVAVLEWGAVEGDDMLDRGVWRRASPSWSGQREQAMLLACGESSFESQWLNVWPASMMRGRWGANLAAQLPARSDRPWSGPLVLAVESDFDGRSWGAAASDGTHVVCVRVPRKLDAVGWLLGHSAGAVVLLAHESVVKLLPPDFPVAVEKMSTASARSATSLFKDHVRSGSLTWDGVLADQLAGADVGGVHGMETIDAARSKGSVSALKAGAWCLWKAATSPSAAFFSA